MQNVWKKRWRLISSVVFAVLALVLLIAAVQTSNSKVCKGINIEVYGASNNFFVDPKHVKEVLNGSEELEGQMLEEINLAVLEDRLKKDKWIENAELFFDKHQVLQVVVEEKVPVARVFTTAGSSFYIDSACRKLPLSKTYSARVPMFTGFPSDRDRLSKPDSALLASVKQLAVFVNEDEFWKAQVAQVDITPAGFEVIPTIGNHTVVLGKGEDYQQKFDRLFSFYKQVWTKVGLNAYEKIDVQYNGQVVATRKGAASQVVDTTAARQALETLIENAKLRREEALANAKTSVRSGEAREERPAATRAVSTAKNEKKQETKSNSVEEKRVPKAVMGRRGNEER